MAVAVAVAVVDFVYFDFKFYEISSGILWFSQFHSFGNSHSERERDAAEAEAAHLRGKGKEISLRPDSSANIMEPPVLYQSGNSWPENSTQVFMDNTLEGQMINRYANLIDGSEPRYNNPNDAGDMVEELILQNYMNSNLPVTGNSWKGMHIGQGNLHQGAGGSGKVSSHGDPPVSKGKQPLTSAGAEDVRNISKQLINTDDNNISSNSLLSSGGLRTKILSSGIPRYLVRNSLMEKGVVCRYPETLDGFGGAGMGQNHEKATGVTKVVPDASLDLSAKAEDPSPQSVADVDPGSLNDGISLREWMKPGYHKVNKSERLHIFTQIVQLVDLAHSQQIALRELRPSCFKLLPSNRVKYVGSLAQKELLDNIPDLDVPFSKSQLSTKRHAEDNVYAYHSVTSKHQKVSENIRSTRQHCEFSARSVFRRGEVNINSIRAQDSGYEQHNSNTEDRPWKKSGNTILSNSSRPQLISVNVQLEEKWYTSPEELHERGSTLFSNIYCLGILLFELLSCSESSELHTKAMLKIQHRILPPNFLSENPKEAGFCLWLLHPEPSSRPTTREILQLELISESRELSSGNQLPSSVPEDYAESELLLQFLASLKEQKDKQASKLVEDIESLETDIREVEKRHLLETNSFLTLTQKDFSNTREQKFLLKEPSNSEACPTLSPVLNMHDDRLMRNINQLENAYFSMRSQILLSDTCATGRLDNDLLNSRYKSQVQNENRARVVNQKPTDRVAAFFDGLCKYTHYRKFEVRGTLRNGDLLNSANVICSLSFDRDEEYFAAAGVSKKIKIFDFHGLLDDSVDIHYPAVEMSSKSKLSSVCWNSYIKNYLASTDYDGVVQLWDASTGQGFAQFKEHKRRAWSVDFSRMDPTKLASGSDDSSVKLWTINEACSLLSYFIIPCIKRKCIGTIKTLANVCCVQFSPHSTYLLAFGSADYTTYCYDLRNTRIPWCTLAGHGKAVSYVKFLDHETLVSASTDNTLKLWDLNKTSSNASSTSACILTFRGHTNEKNFVGLAVSDGYIACGSETNEIYAYYRSLSMPITSHEFGSIDPISGQETSDDNGQFVSSVCWRRKSNTLVAANSSGTIKLLQMV
ncbi:Protein kinase domain [Macleaya cordata]|uniref:Protein kinase domain n=1 Tax=Macleaya cordata TaxID=56857 RepID=A0A200PUM4_MACCD|nr:Protein kinase domain [Macleaya cordata]